MKLYYTLIITCIYSILLGQQNYLNLKGARVDYLSNKTGLPLQVSFDETTNLNSTQCLDWIKTELIGSTESSFIVQNTSEDKLGFIHKKYTQYFKGYKIENATIITHEKNNIVKSFNGDWFKNIEVSNSVSVSEQDALVSALKKVNAKKYKWENEVETSHMKEALNNPNFSFKPKAELILVTSTDIKTKKTVFKYAYKFNIYAETPLYKANVYVDASNGAIIKEQNLICTIDAPGSADTKYSGTQNITTDNYASGYRLREAGRGNGIETYNMKNTQTYSATDFTNTVNNWTVTTNDQAATDAHFGAEATYDFYFQTFNRNSIDDNGYKLLSYVHYSNNYVNAFWDGLRMTYGDGNLSQDFSIMTALDVCGHEITHGVVENTAGLNGGEADALNEAFADIFGTSVEWYARPSQHDWIMGKDIMPSGTGIRDMSNPQNLQQPNTYLGTYWSTSDEPHDNAGPCIYWFYLLSVGGNGTNDNGQSYNVSGITMASAQSIAYRALTTYMTPSTNYASVRNYCIQAAKDLFGACSNEVIQTTNAWHAVGVGAQYAPGAIGTDFNSNQISSCALPTTINFNNTTSAGLTYLWDFGDNTSSTQTNPSHTYTANGTYSIKLTATGCVANSKDSIIKTNYITINAPVNPITTDDNICSGNTATLSASGSGIINWYSNTNMTTLVGTGNIFTTPTLTSNTTYYAVNTVSQTPIFGGPATNTAFGGGSNFNSNFDRYLIFDVMQACKLKTVKVYANTAGNRTIELRNSLGVVLQSTVVNIPAGTQTVTLNFNLTPGTDFQLGTSTLPDMWRNNTNTGAGYPFNIGNLVTITGSDPGSSYYYYFYNWEVQQNNCESAPIAATASVNICTGLNEIISENSVSLYPNPSKDNLTISLSDDLTSKTKCIEIYDALGKIVNTIKVINNATIINVNNLNSGIYTCRIVNSTNQTIIKRFVKE